MFLFFSFYQSSRTKNSLHNQYIHEGFFLSYILTISSGNSKVLCVHFIFIFVPQFEGGIFKLQITNNVMLLCLQCNMEHFENILNKVVKWLYIVLEKKPKPTLRKIFQIFIKIMIKKSSRVKYYLNEDSISNLHSGLCVCHIVPCTRTIRYNIL